MTRYTRSRITPPKPTASWRFSASISVQGGHTCLTACGTGRHLEYLRDRYDVEGLDISLELLTIARQRLPGIRLHHGDMTAFDLGKTFDSCHLPVQFHMSKRWRISSERSGAWPDTSGLEDC